MTGPPSLIADIGATHARFALSDGADIYDEQVLSCADYPDISDAAHAYLRARAPDPAPDRGAFAIACPVLGDHVAMTNHPWQFSIADLQARLSFSQLRVVNDFAATAMAVPALDRTYIRALTSDRTPTDRAPIGVLGPGTGLGVASLVHDGAAYMAVPGEGGHVSVPVHTRREFAIVQALNDAGHTHVSAERVCSGPGLENIYMALCAIEGRDDLPERGAEAIAAAALHGECPICTAALEHMFVWLGRVAGDLALTIGAQGGIYIAGGVAVKLSDALLNSGFPEGFRAKGRFAAYLDDIPCYLIDHPYSAFIGLNRLVNETQTDTIFLSKK